MMNRKELERFFSYVVDKGDCWIWTGHGDRYGIFIINKKRHRAHRWLFERLKWKISNGNFACHACNNKKCVNPDHIYEATNAENIRDAISDGLWTPNRAKLKEKDIPILRKRHAEGVLISVMAKEYGMSISAIYEVTRRTTWANIP